MALLFLGPGVAVLKDRRQLLTRLQGPFNGGGWQAQAHRSLFVPALVTGSWLTLGVALA
jgi:hypothetical protein